jgi:hypothetical protein
MNTLIFKRIFFVAFLIQFSTKLFSQDDLLNMVDEPKQKEFVTATFKGSRLINFHTVETPGKHSLEFRISHRFGDFNTGGYNFWGLDGGASIRLGLEYSHDGRFEFAIGRSSEEKAYDGFLKYRLIRQAKSGGWPLSVTLFAGMDYTTLKDPNKAANGFDRYQYETSRMAYSYQVIIARKFSPSFSFQISPTIVHYNLVSLASDKNDLYSIGFLTRYKFTKRIALTLEYGYRLNKYSSEKYYDEVGAGIDIETGGHVFQIVVTNSSGMIESQFIGHTTSMWQNGGLKIGFNISRMFTLFNKKKK